MEIPDYPQLDRQLRSAAAPMGAAEAHGLLCGLAGAGTELLPRLWLEEALADCEPGDLLVAECRRSLESLYRATAEALDGPGLGVHPLLPTDDASLSERTRALAAWCQGFLYGLGLSGATEAQLSTESREALQDLGRLAAMSTEGGVVDDSEETALEELTEFVWVAFMLIYQDLEQEPDLSP